MLKFLVTFLRSSLLLLSILVHNLSISCDARIAREFYNSSKSALRVSVLSKELYYILSSKKEANDDDKVKSFVYSLPRIYTWMNVVGRCFWLQYKDKTSFTGPWFTINISYDPEKPKIVHAAWFAYDASKLLWGIHTAMQRAGVEKPKSHFLRTVARKAEDFSNLAVWIQRMYS